MVSIIMLSSMILTAIFFTLATLLRKLQRSTASASCQDTLHFQKLLQNLKGLAVSYEPASALHTLIEHDGAGAWPPKTEHDNWPLALRQYKLIYLELAPFLSAVTPSTDDAINQERRQNYRSLMRELLAERINKSQVEAVMAAAEAGNWDLFPRDAYNGFYCCIACLRHAYR